MNQLRNKKCTFTCRRCLHCTSACLTPLWSTTRSSPFTIECRFSTNCNKLWSRSLKTVNNNKKISSSKMANMRILIVKSKVCSKAKRKTLVIWLSCGSVRGAREGALATSRAASWQWPSWMGSWLELLDRICIGNRFGRVPAIRWLIIHCKDNSLMKFVMKKLLRCKTCASNCCNFWVSNSVRATTICRCTEKKWWAALTASKWALAALQTTASSRRSIFCLYNLIRSFENLLF